MSDSSSTELPMFPLYTVVYPGSQMPLKIFEPRYLKMIGQCARDDTEFGVCLIAEGKEVGVAAQPNLEGTAARIVDFNQGKDGLLHVTAEGTRRFQVKNYRVNANQSIIGEIEWQLDRHEVFPQEFLYLVRTLKNIFDRIEMVNPEFKSHYDNPHWVSYRLADLLPVPLVAKQQLLCMDSATERLKVIARWTAELDIS
jgi:Lon protease-like protein